MKRTIKTIASAMILSASITGFLASCSALEESRLEGSNAIEFRTNIGQYSVKATDTAFEEYDAVSIYALDPINSGNVKYVVRNGVLTSDTPICWNEGQKEETIFILMYPYNPELEYVDFETPLSFAVNKDQSSHLKYTASDLITGGAVASPADKYVDLKVSHALSQVYITIQNNSKKEIAGVTLSGVKLNAETDERNSLVAVGPLSSVQACPVTSGSTKSWVLIIPPQTARPDLVIDTTDGEQITCTLSEDFHFNPGFRATASVVIGADAKVTEFYAEIADWIPGGQMYFTEEEPGVNWVYAGTGKLLDDVAASVIGFPHVELDVEYYVDADDANHVMLKNPYKNWPYFGDGIEYVDGAEVIVRKNINGWYIEKGSRTGVVLSGYGEMLVESYCKENGWGKEYYFVDYYNGCWTTEYNSIIARFDENNSAYVSNYSGMTTFTEEGCIRYPVYYNFSDMSYDNESGNLNLVTPLDMSTIGVSWIPYSEGFTQDVLDDIIIGSHKNQLFFQKGLYGENALSIPAKFTETGVYLLVAVARGIYADGKEYWGYNTYRKAFVAPGDTAPACKPEIVSCKASDVSSTGISLVVKVPDVRSCYMLYAPKSVFDEAQIDESQYLDFLFSEGESVRGTAEDFSGKGQIVNIDGLDKNTEYVILVGAENMFGNRGWAKAVATTGGDMQFVSIGTGKYYDNFSASFMASDSASYAVPVEIQQESSGKPVYRVIAPYAELMRQKPALFTDAGYNDKASEYIEFFTHKYESGNYLFYKPYYTGISFGYDSWGIDFNADGKPDKCPLLYTHYSGDVYSEPEKYTDTFQNLEVSEGVFQLAPYVIIEGSNYVYDLRSAAGLVYICLPGHDIDQLTKSILNYASGKKMSFKPFKRTEPTEVEKIEELVVD